MKILKPLIASVMASVSLVGLAQSDFSQVGLSQPGYKYEKPAGADNFYHTYNASEQQVSFLNQYKIVVPGAGHVDLYDRTDLIPFDTLVKFFKKNL